MWLLHGVAEELDNPFDGDSTDLDADQLIEDFNQRLCSLLGHKYLQPPAESHCANEELPSRWKDFKHSVDSGVKSLHNFLEHEKHVVTDLITGTPRGSSTGDKAASSGNDASDLEVGKLISSESSPPEGYKSEPSSPDSPKKASSIRSLVSRRSFREKGKSKTTMSVDSSQHKVAQSHFSSSSAARIQAMVDELQRTRSEAALEAEEKDRHENVPPEMDGDVQEPIVSEISDTRPARHNQEARGDQLLTQGPRLDPHRSFTEAQGGRYEGAPARGVLHYVPRTPPTEHRDVSLSVHSVMERREPDSAEPYLEHAL